MKTINNISAVVMVNQEPFRLITTKSGMTVNVLDHEWRILPHKGKGHIIKVAWVYESVMSIEDKALIIEVLIHYVRTKNASTAAGIVFNTKPYLMNGIPALTHIRTAWSGLKTNQKKGINQFFGTLSKLGYIKFDEFHQFTSRNLDKESKNFLDPLKGALSEIEFDSLAKQVNDKLRSFDWSESRELSFFLQGTAGFGELRNSVSTKLMLSIVRRPIQLSILKWADVIPAGASFNDPNIQESDQIGSTGVEILQLRVFHAKETGVHTPRAFPERHPLHLSENLSTTLMQYKKLYIAGVLLHLKSQGIKLDQSELLSIMLQMPIFPSTEIFSMKFNSAEIFKSMFNASSTAYHVGEQIITSALRNIKIISDRIPDCITTNNRIRHTVLTRGAQDGLSAIQLARITGVTVPAARHYVDMDYRSRQLIDQNFVGNAFLRHAFSSAITLIPEGEEIVSDQQFNEVGGVKCRASCRNCPAELGRPLACYGCPNFRPILEADHRMILQLAEDKLSINTGALINPLHLRSIEKLRRQIEWVKIIINTCDEIRLSRKELNVK